MGTKIYHPISPEVQDQTGLALCGRHQDGRYQYRSVSLFHHRNVMSLTHNERVGLALCYALAKKMRPGTATAIYPMTKTNSASGWGSYGSARLWLMKPHLAELGRHYIPKLCAGRRAIEQGYQSSRMRWGTTPSV